ncbi:kinase-like domain-containing protein [Massariosphaeria phaeospora]|uniref:Kinase-like domain-containing protein n=1 Tax=Massariosphaeria phaeospora TaxID=100035 RepID=A0A7C8I2P9_9PLEO|nr:kinase-like domain-containing protein [Massariosphaeria phaeospora]
MPLTNKMANAQREQNCFAITAERKYYHVNNSFIKRSLRPSEWQISPSKGTIHVPRLSIERILNEAAALTYVKENSTIPVPTLHACFEDDQSACLVTSYVDGVSMSALNDEEKAFVARELEYHVSSLHALRGPRLGGASGHVILPYRMSQKTFRDDWELRTSSSAGYPFCHNDLSQQNVIVDPDTLKIAAIIDWEYAGFFPEEFDVPFYRRLGPSVAINGEEDDTDKFMQFVKDHQVMQI